MWPFLAKLFAGGAAQVIDAGGNVAKSIWGDQAATDQQLSTEQLAVLNQYATEFTARTQRTLWDSFVDGVNRLIRPGLAIGAQAALMWAAVDPVTFSITMQALQLVPEMLWIIWAGIWAFYFGGRIIEKAPGKFKVDPASIALAKDIAAQRAALQGPPPAELPLPGTTPASEVDSAPEKYNSPAPAVPLIAGDPSTAERTVAATIWGEARGEPWEGKLAVAWVIRNRVEHPGWWGRDWVGVCTAKWQFSCWFDVQAPRVRTVDESDSRFGACLAAARQVMSGTCPDPTGGADHYYADTISAPKWAKGRTPTTKIGHHIFYRIGLQGGG